MLGALFLLVFGILLFFIQYLAECLFPVVCRKCALKNYCTGRFTAETAENLQPAVNVPLGTTVRAGLRQKLLKTFNLP